MSIDIIEHVGVDSRFQITKQGLTAYVLYEIWGDTLTITSTYVPKPLEGQGVAAALTKACYDYAAERGLKPAATCSYAVAWLERHK